MHTDIKHRYSISARRMSRSIIRELLKLANKPGIISFAGGLPDPQTFPHEELKEICDGILEDSPQVTLQYSATEGLSSFRDLLVEFVAGHGLEVSREELIVTTASQQSLDLVGKIFIDRGDTVIVENPSYLGAVSAFKSYGVRFLPIDMDEQGIKTDLLHRKLRELKKSAGSGIEYCQNMPKFIYTIPDFQNPSGITMSLQRRKELLNIAEEFDLIIVEDVPYKWLRYSGEDQPLIGSLENRSNSTSPGAGFAPPDPPGHQSVHLFQDPLPRDPSGLDLCRLDHHRQDRAGQAGHRSVYLRHESKGRRGVPSPWVAGKADRGQHHPVSKQASDYA